MDQLRRRIAARKAELDRLRREIGDRLDNLEHVRDLELTYTSNAIERNSISKSYAAHSPTSGAANSTGPATC